MMCAVAISISFSKFLLASTMLCNTKMTLSKTLPSGDFGIFTCNLDFLDGVVASDDTGRGLGTSRVQGSMM